MTKVSFDRSKADKAMNSPRRAARLAAVQALYQIEQVAHDPDLVIKEMIQDEFSTLTKDSDFNKPDTGFFSVLVKSTSENIEDLDQKIIPNLADGWRIERLSSVTRAILRAGLYELVYEKLTPRAVIMNEYIEITKSFCEKNEVNFVNGILNRMAKAFRAD